MTGSAEAFPAGCGGTASGFSTTVVVSGGGGGGGCLAGVWARAAVAQVVRTSASRAICEPAPVKPLIPHERPPEPLGQSECD